tara:strand:+ start:4972 stop:5172 length:201 start_codon:yes stop_codon:yes gene_type:complete
MFKAIAIICSVWIADGRAKQECYNHKFEWQFETKKQCQIRLFQYKSREISPFHKVIIDECIYVKKS